MRVDRIRNSTELAEFITLPQKLYRGEKHYFAPLDRELISLIHPRYAAFYRHGHAAFWIVRRNGVPAGRISTQIDYLAYQRQPKTGFFGCLDSINDPEVLNALFAEAESWLRREGCERAQGPFILSINGQSGLLIEGQENAPMIGMPWHPKYLGKLVEGNGYKTAHVLHSFAAHTSSTTLDTFKSRSLDHVLSIRPIRMKQLETEAELCRLMFNEAWRGNWGFIELSRSDMIALMREIKSFIFEDCGVIAELEGRPIAFMLSLPNLHDVTVGLGSSPSIPGWLRLIWRAWRRQYQSCRILLLGVAPNLPIVARAQALEQIFAHALRTIRSLGGGIIEAGWVLESNRQMQAIVTHAGLRSVRTFKIYEKAI